MDNLKINVCMIVHNEEMLLPISLGQVIEWADKVIIIDGSPEGPSDDRTENIILRFMQTYPNKIIYNRGSYGTHNWDTNWDKLQRNKYLEYFDEESWLFQIDADEFYSKKDLDTIRQELNKPENQDVVAVQMNNVHFFRDHKHYLEDAGLYDVRIARYIPGCHYKDNTVLLCHPTGAYMCNTGRVLQIKGACRFHVGHGVPWSNYKERLSKFVKRGEHDPKLLDKDPRIECPGWKPPSEDILIYDGPYPELMQAAIDNEHPWFVGGAE